MRTVLAIIMLSTLTANALAAEVTLDGKALDAALLAVVDGDSVTVDGREWRLMGYDTPEIERAKCEGERRVGVLAKRRLEQLVGGAQRIALVNSGERDRHKRPLGRMAVDGRDVGDILVEELYARPYNGGPRRGWCSRDSRDDLIPGPQPARKLGPPD